MTIGSGWVERTWRSGPAPTRRRRRGSTPSWAVAEDVPAWRARLNWGIATDRIDVVKEALTHLPASDSTPAQIHRLKARLAANRGDVAAERRELESLCQSDPADPTALVRLAHLAENEGQPARAAELLRKKLEIDRLRARYEKLHKRSQPVRDAVEMAHLAEQLGRVFEARAFLTLATSEDPDRADLRRHLERLTPGPRTEPEPGQTLAQAPGRPSLSRLILSLCTIE